MFFILSKTNFAVQITFIFHLQNVFNFEWSKILSSGKGLNNQMHIYKYYNKTF